MRVPFHSSRRVNKTDINHSRTTSVGRNRGQDASNNILRYREILNESATVPSYLRNNSNQGRGGEGRWRKKKEKKEKKKEEKGNSEKQ